MKVVRHQHIYDLAEVCAAHGIQEAVICPGSRSAPLVLAFSNHQSITCRVIPDERTAGFIALGMAQASQRPVVLICTSGSAAYNFAPAIAEAFYQEVPLIICTADRPLEWIGQRDGQTIQQERIYGGHVKAFFNVQAEDQPEGNWLSNRMMNEAILLSQSGASGPVHLNFPFREPLYPAGTDSITFRKPRVIQEKKSSRFLDTTTIAELRKTLTRFDKILIVAGQYLPKKDFIQTLHQSKNIPIVGEILSNLHGVPMLIQHADTMLSSATDEDKNALRPALLLTWGNGILSKNTKLFLRKFPANQHWHIQEEGTVADTFQNLSQIIRCTPEYFCSEILNKSTASARAKIYRKNYLKQWLLKDEATQITIESTVKKSGTEAEVVQSILSALPARCDLHLANSMSVRHANLIGLTTNRTGVKVFSNRGTSGIDGCTSTAVGHQLKKKDPQILITGDVAFFYDGNAFWHNEKPVGLRICLINNKGGRIFQIIDGPRDRKEAEPYFVGPQPKNAETFCAENSIAYQRILQQQINEPNKLRILLKDFFKDSSPKIKLIEFFCESGNELSLLQEIRKKLKDT